MGSSEILSQLEAVEREAHEAIASLASEADVTDARRRFLGKKGPVQQVLKGLGGVEASERPKIGARANEIKRGLAGALDGRLAAIESERREADLRNRRVDLTLPPRLDRRGGAHPIIAVREEIEAVFVRLGFSIAHGPEAEFDLFNFEALNFPPDHPARDMQDTLVLEGDRLLRTHTSPVQVRTMLSYDPPIRVIAPGAVYRRDDDITHSPMFFQVEGLHIDRGVHLGHLKGVLGHFAEEIFGAGTPIRLRPSFFPFTEPSVEVDIGCPFCNGSGCRVCSHTGWLEILGAGIVDPNVLAASGIDPEEWSGWAFGVGVERVAMLKYGIRDIRLLYESDQRFLSQFA